MDKIGIDVRGIEIGATAHGAENRVQWFRTSESARVEAESSDFQIVLFEILIAEATDFHRHRPGQLARKIAHMHARTAVNMRRIFVSEEENFHAGRVEQASGLLSIEFARRGERHSSFSL